MKKNILRVAIKFFHSWFGKLVATIGFSVSFIGLFIQFGVLESNTVISTGMLGLVLFFSISLNFATAWQALENRGTQATGLCATDVELLRQFSLDLPSGESMELLKHHDFGSSFRDEDLRQVQMFRHEWDNAEHEFVDSDLEKCRREILSACADFLILLAQYSVTEKGIVRRLEIQRINNSAKYDKISAQLNNYAENIYRLHQKIVREGKKRQSEA